MGRIKTSTDQDLEECLSDDDEEDQMEEVGEDESLQSDSQKRKRARIRRPRRKTLVIKLLDRTIAYNLLMKKIKDLWRPKSEVDVEVIDNGYFFAKFALSEDYDYAKFEGPWMIFGHYLTVRPWQPSFDPNRTH